MKYSFQFLFQFAILAAILAAAIKKECDWTLVAFYGVSYLLVSSALPPVFHREGKARESEPLSESSRPLEAREPQAAASVRGFSPRVLFHLFFSGGIAASLLAILWSSSDEESQAFSVRGMSPEPANVILMLATILLASGFVAPRPEKRTGRRARLILYIAILVAMLSLLMLTGNAFIFWLIYIACKGIELGLSDPGHLLGQPEVLELATAFFKALLGVVGFSVWACVAYLAVRRIHRAPQGFYTPVWTLCLVGLAATWIQWKLLYGDFPLLFSGLGETREEVLQVSSLWILVLGAVGFLQFCLLDRTASHVRVEEHRRVWGQRVLGATLLLPAFVWLGEIVYSLVQNGRLFSVGSFSWTNAWSELSLPAFLLTLALFGLGMRLVAAAPLAPPRIRAVSWGAQLQVLGVGVVLGIALPAHWAATSFYLEAAITQIPIHVWP